MNTRTVIVEILLIGLITSAWFLPLINTLDFTDISNISSDYVKILAIALSYFIGMTVNQVCHILIHPLNKIFKLDQDKDKIRYYRTKAILDGKGNFFEYLNFRRSIVRIFRANIFNFVIIILFYLFNVGNLQAITKDKLSYIILLILILLLLSIIYSYIKTTRNYNQFVLDCGECDE